MSNLLSKFRYLIFISIFSLNAFADWTEIKVAEDATPFSEHFVAFKSDSSFHRFVDVMTIRSENEGDIKVGYVNWVFTGWSPTGEKGYCMDYLVNVNRVGGVSAKAALRLEAFNGFQVRPKKDALRRDCRWSGQIGRESEGSLPVSFILFAGN